MVKEVVQDYWDSVFAIRFRRNCTPFLLPEQARPFAISSTYTAPEHPPNPPLPLMLDAIGVKELRGPDLPRTPLLFVIPRLYPALVAKADLIPLLVGPVLVFFCPRKPESLILL